MFKTINHTGRKFYFLLTLFLLALTLFTGCSKHHSNNAELAAAINTDYSNEANWAYLEKEGAKDADIFFICPTVYGGSADKPNMSLDDGRTKKKFLGAVNMEKGIYDGCGRFYAPYYQQVGLSVYKMAANQQESYFAVSYGDVKAAFLYYLHNYNQGRPIILAGFSQGADLCIRLIKDCFHKPELQKLLVACYAVGWRFTEEETAAYPHLKAAQGEKDTGVVISFNSEAENVTSSLSIPAGIKSKAINPLNWKTDSTPADKSLNLGACFTDYSGAITRETASLTGAYIDQVRGALKVTDVSSKDYPPVLDIFTDGVYHLYDYQFFYRNLQKNVKTRLDAYLNR